jgi:hypothetical protein|tara:strand:+ start:70 stop:213 length:144 start_codon:yes stop_codon:yes gene_type:complete
MPKIKKAQAKIYNAPSVSPNSPVMKNIIEAKKHILEFVINFFILVLD